jgi:hypothetical protein
MFNPNGNENRNIKKHLIVLVPGELVETAKFARQIRWLALQQQRDVIYIARSNRNDDYMTTMRLLATVEAITRDGTFEVDSRQVEAGNWVKAIQSVYKPGDLIVCHEEQKVATGLGKKTPLNQHLAQQLHLPTNVLSGFYQGETFHIQPLLKSLIFWIGSLVIVLGFSLVEYRVDHLMSGAARILIMAILLVFESGLIYQLNKYSG